MLLSVRSFLPFPDHLAARRFGLRGAFLAWSRRAASPHALARRLGCWRVSVCMFSLLHALCFAYSGGGGEGGEGQTCDAIGLCNVAWEGGVVSCPPGMTKVAPPERSDVYSVSSPTTTYVGSELVEIHVRVTAPLIQAKRNAGVLQCSCNSTVENCAGLLAVRRDAHRAVS